MIVILMRISLIFMSVVVEQSLSTLSEMLRSNINQWQAAEAQLTDPASHLSQVQYVFGDSYLYFFFTSSAFPVKSYCCENICFWLIIISCLTHSNAH